jgi:hypothetical protein
MLIPVTQFLQISYAAKTSVKRSKWEIGRCSFNQIYFFVLYDLTLNAKDSRP